MATRPRRVGRTSGRSISGGRCRIRESRQGRKPLAIVQTILTFGKIRLLLDRQTCSDYRSTRRDRFVSTSRVAIPTDCDRLSRLVLSPGAASMGSNRRTFHMADERIRRQIAFLAAQMMYHRTETEYFTAKRKAARQLGVEYRYRPADLPSNKEIRDQIQAMARMHEGPKRLENLRDMRVDALRLMRLLARFRPRLDRQRPHRARPQGVGHRHPHFLRQPGARDRHARRAGHSSTTSSTSESSSTVKSGRSRTSTCTTPTISS